MTKSKLKLGSAAMLFAFVGPMLLPNGAAAERLSLSGLKSDIDTLDERLTACEQGIGGACPGSPGPQGEQGPPGPDGPPGPAADAPPPVSPVIGAAFIGNFKGELTDPVFRDAFGFRSLAFGASRFTSLHSGGGGAGQPQLADVSITINDGGQAPAIFLLAAKGEHIPEVRIVLAPPGAGGSGPGGNAVLVELLLKNVILTVARSLPATRPGDPSLVELAFNFERIEVVDSVYLTEYDVPTRVGTSSCKLAAFSFVNAANDSGGSGAIPIAGFDFGIIHTSTGGHTGGGSGASTLSPVTIRSGFFADAPCLFGALIDGSLLNVQIHDELAGGGSTKLTLDQALASKFQLSSDPLGEVRVLTEFDYREIRWEATEPGGSTGGTGSWSPATGTEP